MTTDVCYDCDMKEHIAAFCSKAWSKGLNALDEGEERILGDTNENDDELHAWCMLENVNNGRRSSASRHPFLSYENMPTHHPKIITHVKAGWVNHVNHVNRRGAQ